ncbi:MAG: arylsulfatase [Bryobacterales bacterium]|nr:arylsulfatase [Bryobacterales bacterium]
MITRRALISAAAPPALLAAAPARRPNVIVIMTDDQGYGDLSLHGNPHLKTPALDRIAREGVQFSRFHSSPVCSPTRASLMTGRYNYRTGVVDTYLGRSMMHPDEVTLPECLRLAGYRTGIFGKWHLGDNYPLRAMDQGFQETLTLRGGGLAQPASPPGTGYFDPPLEHDGRPLTGRGYCTDIFFDAAQGFIEHNRRNPFFAYIACNAPHTPLEIGEEWVAPYRQAGLDDTTARIYGMVANVDHNAGRLLGRLKELDLERDTLVVFLTDNGPQQSRYNANLRGLKGTVYEGGIRVPCFLRWPARIQAGATDSRISAHIDLMPTILDACGVALPRLPEGRKIDGLSLLQPPKERSLFFQWHRGDQPQPFRACAVLTERWKLIGTPKQTPELYDLPADPAETRDLAAQQPDVVARLRRSYDDWFADVARDHGYAPPKIALGSREENPVLLTRQDWRGPAASWDAAGLGHYEVDVRRAGSYQVALRFPPLAAAATAELDFGGSVWKAEAAAGASEAIFPNVTLPAGPGRIEGRLHSGGRIFGAHYIQVTNR